jgi:hypothetical protein
MRRLITALAIAGLFALSAAPVLAAPAVHSTSDPVTGVFFCGATQYTFTGGTWEVVAREVDSPTADRWLHLSVEAHANNVTARDEAGNLYNVRGAWHFGGTYLANLGAETFHFGMHLQIVRQGGGAVDNVSAVLTGSPFGNTWIDIGSCEPL